MKAYTEWLKAHPAVWEALQEEWEPEVGDWCIGQTSMNRNLLGLVHLHRTKDAEKGWAVSRYRTGRLDWYCNKHKRIRENWHWLPSLGQLVRMTAQLGAEPVLQSRAGVLAGILAWMCFDDAWSGPEHTSEWECEPEIALTALWAKVKGVE